MINIYRAQKLIQLILCLIIFSSCVRSVTPPPPKTVAPAATPAAPAVINNAPATPTLLSCVASPLGGSLNNACTLTAASPSDPDGNSVSYVDDGSTCSAVAVSVLTGDVTFTAPAKGATCLVKVKAFDGSLYSGFVSSGTITGSNNLPNAPASVACANSPLGGSVGNVCTLTAAGVPDPDGDSITYSNDASTCAATVVNSVTGNATFTAPAKGATCLIKVRAFDGTAYSSSVSSATITAANNAPNTPASLTCPASPVAESTGNICTTTGANPFDPDGDNITYVNDASSCAAVVVNAATGGVTFTAPASGMSCTVRVKAYDGSGYSVAVVSTINGTNNAPTTPNALTCTTSPLGGSLNNVCTLTAASPVDPDGDSVTYFNDGSSCAAVVVNSTTGNVTFTAPAKGATCLVKVKSYDGALYSNNVSSGTITGDNNSPNIPTTLTCTTAPVAGSTNNACTLTAASPADLDGDAVTYEDDASTCGSVVVNSATGNATFTAPASGATCVVKVKAHDGTAYGSARTSATITGTNTAPNTPSALSCATSPLAGSTNNACTLTAASPVDNNGDTVSYADDSSTCAAVSVSVFTGDATFTAPAKGATCVVKVKAYDGTSYGSAISSATITGANNSPTIPAAISCNTSPPGESAGNICTITAANPADPDGDTVTYVEDGSTCSNVVVNATTGSSTFTAPAKGATCLVKIKSHDGTSYSGVISSTTITGANNAPSVPSALNCTTSPVANSIGNTCTMTATNPADPDNDTVTYVDDGSTCSTVVVNATTGNATFTAPAGGASCLVKVKAYDSSLYSSAISSATITAASLPAAPTGVSATSGATQASISWNAVAGATSYNIYWRTTSGVTKANGTKITGVTSPYNHTGLVAATTYYYIVTAVNGAGEGSASSEVSATAQAAAGGSETFYSLIGWDYSESWGGETDNIVTEETIAKKTLNLRQGTLSFSAEYDWESISMGSESYYVEVWIGGVLKLHQEFAGAPNSWATPHTFNYVIGAGDVGIKEVKIIVHSEEFAGWASATLHSVSVPVTNPIAYSSSGSYAFVIPNGVTSLTLSVSGGGGGGAGYGDGQNGGDSTITYAGALKATASGGGAGIHNDPALPPGGGSGVLTAQTITVGGGSPGGGGGSSGSAGGRVQGTLAVTPGQTLFIVVGEGGASGNEEGEGGDDGTPGVVTLSW